MASPEQLNYCKICKNQKFSMSLGAICRFTDQSADFEGTCNSFEEDTDLVHRLNRTEITGCGSIASTEKRFANYIIDSICFYVFCIIIGALLGIVMAVYFPTSVKIFDRDSKMVNYLFGFCIMFIFYFISEALTGRTLGKLITKTKVVKENGLPPGFRDILLRTLCRFIPFDALSFFSQDNLGWHDKLSKTKVVVI
jgi:uncharacterized RDD family membrane protein YckC